MSTSILTPPAAPNDPATGTPAPTPTGGATGGSWLDALGLPDDIKSDPSLKPIPDAAAAVKSYVHAQRMIGADKIVVPGKSATEADWQGVFRKLGLPESADKYEFRTPEGAKLDDQFLGSFKQTAYQAGVLPQQAEKLLGWYHQEASKIQAAQDTQFETKRAQELEALKTELGANYDPTISRAQAAAAALLPKPLQEVLAQSKLDSHPEMIKLFGKLADFLKEDQIQGDGPLQVQLTPQEARQKIDNIMGDMKHPYYTGTLEQKAEIQKEIDRLFGLAFGANGAA